MKFEQSIYSGPDWEAYCRTTNSSTVGAPAFRVKYKGVDYWLVWSNDCFDVLRADGVSVGSGSSRTEAFEDAKFWINHPID